MTELNKDTFETTIGSTQPVLVDFWASWCGPCQMLAPVLAEVSEERSDNSIFKVNVDENPELAARFGVSTIPTLIVFKDSQEVERTIGVKPKSEINAMLDRNK